MARGLARNSNRQL